jgi:hypothetical protein
MIKRMKLKCQIGGGTFAGNAKTIWVTACQAEGLNRGDGGAFCEGFNYDKKIGNRGVSWDDGVSAGDTIFVWCSDNESFWPTTVLPPAK